MLTSNMNLAKMIEFEPTDLDMAMLPLDVVTYIKVSVISSDKEDNYDFVRYLFLNAEIKDYFSNYESTVFYDFDIKDKFISVFELYGTSRYTELELYIKEVLNDYSHKCDVVFNIYTHDNKHYRISDVDCMVSKEELSK